MATRAAWRIQASESARCGQANSTALAPADRPPPPIVWQNTVLKAPGSEKYIVCNADEGDSGTFADRIVMESDPFMLIEGMTIAGLAVGDRVHSEMGRRRHGTAPVLALDRAVHVRHGKPFAPHAVPQPQLRAAGKAQLLQRVGDVIFDGVEADVQTRADLRIRHAVAHGVDDAPLGGSEDVGMGWPPALPACGAHGGISNAQPLRLVTGKRD